MRLERKGNLLNALDNALTAAVAAWAEDAAELAIANARQLLRPAMTLAAALRHADADGPRLRTLVDLADLLDVKLERGELATEAWQFADRVRAAQAEVEDALVVARHSRPLERDLA